MYILKQVTVLDGEKKDFREFTIKIDTKEDFPGKKRDSPKRDLHLDLLCNNSNGWNISTINVCYSY